MLPVTLSIIELIDLTDSLTFHLVNCHERAYMADAGKSWVGSKGAVLVGAGEWEQEAGEREQGAGERKQGAGEQEQATRRAGRWAGDSCIRLYIIVK